MGTASLKVGGEVSSWCTRCREMRDHQIELMEKDRPKRVVCKVCKGSHLYRPQPPKSRTRTATATRSMAKSTPNWEDLMAVADLDQVRTYAMKRSFAAGDVISHKVFGIGVVIREVDEQKMEVSFQEGTRLLVRNRSR
jgi:hypothetical protein